MLIVHVRGKGSPADAVTDHEHSFHRFIQQYDENHSK
jgi:hypothetical protein